MFKVLQFEVLLICVSDKCDGRKNRVLQKNGGR